MNARIGTVMRPCQGEVVCGDGHAVHNGGSSLLVAVVDGLGHGPGAAEASEAFLSYVKDNQDLALDRLMMEAHKSISSTRGAAAALIRVDFELARLTFCGVGNIHFHSVAEGSMHPVSAPGIVGHRVRKVIPYEFALPSKGYFAVCSDGISSRMHLEDIRDDDPQVVAETVLAEHGKFHDDATVVVVSYGAAA